MARRSFLSQVIALPFLGMTAWSEQATHEPPLKRVPGDQTIQQKRHSRFCMGSHFRRQATRCRYFC